MKKNDKDIKHHVRDRYAEIAQKGTSCCPSSSCCSGSGMATDISRCVGYSHEEMESVPEGANLGLGCGNPVAIASLSKGETVLDLGAGAGFDAFLASSRVGATGRVIGVDMTREMIERARNNAKKSGITNVEFRLGEIEALPVDSSSVDVIISNCVINLSPDKAIVFREAFRVLKPGGRLMVSDLVLTKELPPAIRDSVEAYVGCLAGAARKEDYIRYMKDAGFQGVHILSESGYPVEAMANDATAKAVMKDLKLAESDLAEIEHTVVSIKIKATKP
jgi:arsenite methyltransferase